MQLCYVCVPQRKRKLGELEEKLSESERKKAHLEEQVRAAQVGREDSVSHPLFLPTVVSHYVAGYTFTDSKHTISG